MKRYPDSSAGHITGRILLKKLVPVFAALLVAGCGEKSLSDSAIKKALKEAVEKESLQVRKHLYYRVNESEPYSGWVKEMYDSGQVQGLGQFKDGKPDGLLTAWAENGQRVLEATYKDGNLDGPWLKWYENGQKHLEQTYKDGQLDGPFTGWDENGQKWSERTYKDGKEDGPYTNWHQNGQKQQEGACKDGELDGLMTMWHENGQKAAEVTFKDGKEVSAKYWNSKGEDVETWEEANQ